MIQVDIKLLVADRDSYDVEAESLLDTASSQSGKESTFTIQCTEPIHTMVDKLHALNRLSQNPDPKAVGVRARDVYDLACIFKNIGYKLSPNDITELYETIHVADTQRTRAGWDVPIPQEGLRSLPVWDPQTPQYRALGEAYDKNVTRLMFKDAKMSYEEAQNVIHHYMHFL